MSLLLEPAQIALRQFDAKTMKYLHMSTVNASNGDLESLVAEGEAGGRPWAVVFVTPTSKYASFCSDDDTRGWSAPASGMRPYRALRVRCTDLGANSYLRMFLADWAALYEELQSIKAPDGARYHPKIVTSYARLWDEDVGDRQECYAETRLGDGPEKDFEKVAAEFTEAMSPFFVKMAVTGDEPITVRTKA